MVQSKHHKSKPKKKPHVKKQGKQADITEFRSQLDALGLKIIQVTADGNCFFRALADQLEGNEELHMKYRQRVVQYILKHRENFEPFIEDDVPFEEYLQSMEKDGTWAGHMELQAASLVTHSNICIHRILSPRWYIRNFDNHEARMVHLSYHNEEHYNSVRLKEDPCNGPSKPIVIKVDADLSPTSHKAQGTARSKRNPCNSTTDSGSVKLVMVGSGCKDVSKVSQVLQQLNGDVDATIEFLIAEQEADEDTAENDVHRTLLMDGHNENGECEQPEMAPVEANCGEEEGKCEKKDGAGDNDIKSINNEDGSCPIDKVLTLNKIHRNKVCPCGSKKKYKACCGSVKRNSSTEYVTNQKLLSGKGKKERKQNKKGGHTKIVSLGGSEGKLPDMGALCI